MQANGLKNTLQTHLTELNTNVGNVRAQLDSLSVHPELGLEGMDRRGGEAHGNLNPANLPGAPPPEVNQGQPQEHHGPSVRDQLRASHGPDNPGQGPAQHQGPGQRGPRAG